MTSSEAPAKPDVSVVRVFGGMGLDHAGEPVSMGGPRQRRLLALLVLRAGSVASHDWLAEHLWSDDERPEATVRALRTYVSRLRQVLPEPDRDWVTTASGGYQFDAPADVLEHQRFVDLRSHAASARGRGDPLAALGLLDAALTLWRGEPFQELEDVVFAQPVIEQLRLDRLEMLEERWECSLALGRHTQITGELAVFVGENRLRDRATHQYSLALHRSGRTVEALRVLAEHRQLRAEVSGLDPSPAIRELEQAMLSGDATLDVNTSGRPLRGYRLLEEIGNGSFSIVWRGVQPSVGREVAIKQIRSELASQPDFIRRFEAEAHLVARIEHPHVVPLVDFWRDPDSAYLVMRFLRGGTLERRLDDGALGVAATLALATQIGGALSAAHQRGIVHRDVKSGNIMFDESGNAFLTDFGIALEAAKSTGPAAAFSTGSPAYSAPEQIRRELLGPQADVFSLGVVLFECLTGSLPFSDSASVAELVEHQLHTDYPRVTDLRPELSSAIADAIAKATAKAPHDRFTSVEAFVSALNAGRVVVDGPIETPLGLATSLPNPYLGLRAFDEADSAKFHGREALVNELLTRFRGTGLASRCIGVIGPSGSGKSSLVRAGLTPALRAGAVDGADQWLVTTMVPGSNPYESLEAALLRIAVNPPTTLLHQLQDGKRGILRCLRRCMVDDMQKILLTIDQFEELFTMGDDSVTVDFLDALAVAVEDPQSPLRLVFTLRADLYGGPLGHATFARVLDAGGVNVTPLSADELERAMVQPAQELGAGFEPGLVALMVADCIGLPAPLPLLQYALSELFERREGAQLTIAAYEGMGRLTGALATRAEALHDHANNAQRAAMRRCFGRLVSPAEDAGDLRRRVRTSDLGDDPETRWLLEQFGHARLFTFDREHATREPTVEVAHEALLREWPRLARWLDEDRDLLRSSDAIAIAATNWHAAGRPAADLYRGARLEHAADVASAAADRLRPVDTDFIEASQSLAETQRHTEQQRIVRLRKMVLAIGIALVFALAASGIAFNRQQRANEQTRMANEQALLADELSNQAQEQTRRANEQATLAEAQAVLAKQQAELARESELDAEAQTRQAELATLVSRSAAASRADLELSVLLALEAQRRSPTSEAHQAVLNALGTRSAAVVSSLPFRFSPEENCALRGSDNTEQLQFGVRNGNFASRDLFTGKVIEYDRTPERCVFWHGDAGRDRSVVISQDMMRAWSGSFGGPLATEISFEGRVVAPGLLSSRGVGLATRRGGVFELATYDYQTGNRVDEAVVIEAEQLLGARLDANSMHAIISFGLSPFAVTPAAAGWGRLVIWNHESGEIVLDLTVPTRLEDAVIDVTASEIIGVNNDENTLVTMDLSTGEILASVEAFDVDVDSIGLRPDGLILAVSRNQAQLFDRRAGPVGEPTPLRDIAGAFVRGDGLVQAQSVRGIELLDVNSSGLAERTAVLDGPSNVMIREGLAMIGALDGSGFEVLALATGERRKFGPITAEGARADNVVPVDAADLDAGMWAISRQGITRWVEGNVAESLRWEPGPSLVLDRSWYGDRYAHVRRVDDGSYVAELFALEPGQLTKLLSVPVASLSAVHPALDDGLFVVDMRGKVRTYSSEGAVVAEVDTGVINPDAFALDPASNQLAIGGRGIGLIDLAENRATSLTQTGRTANLGFAKSGKILTSSGRDGTLRLWDLERGVFAGVAWTGTSAVPGNAPQNDPVADTMWFATSGKLVEIPLNPNRWVERACELVDRDFTQDEWDRFVPGNGPLQSACG